MRKKTKAFSGEVDSGSPSENATKKHFQAKWTPVRRQKMRKKTKAFSGEVDSGSPSENAKKNKSIFRRSGLRFAVRKCDKKTFSGEVDFGSPSENATTKKLNRAQTDSIKPGFAVVWLDRKPRRRDRRCDAAGLRLDITMKPPAGGDAERRPERAAFPRIAPQR
ncbi:MAG: hypothetical protein U1E81_17400 [Xanthobacteraceae bacterium]